MLIRGRRIGIEKQQTEEHAVNKNILAIYVLEIINMCVYQGGWHMYSERVCSLLVLRVFPPVLDINLFLGAFAKLRKKTICCVVSVRMKQLCSHWRHFHEIWYLSIFR